jgi:allantoinase
MSSFPARLAGLGDRKGKIAPGYDADLVVWDPDGAVTVTPETTFHRHPMTPYEGRTLTGAVATTYLRGRPVYHNGIFPGDPSGMIVRRSVVNAERAR